ncbi:EmrB/QacA subfamily drug resistance transporter [Actinoplanes lutulentus]|uniref:EmrB/QacA subfamily drug resistance transporter n=1 Tax=Actinoplanes lutulentus TaxID=1287878 RepID=A0A327Z9J7_9ACTN|nr:MFS transporter [Actinoplanes lutulentus]MBB2946803.1 EmrB/QacA subfamily drug resistance transporter [Actinoplanes lutulentus]RAK35695.1 EmrB/QacA subfamily drug resistance transporter [Actinoplanes lutulentus]
MHKWSPLVAVCLGTFLLLVDVTVVVVALPDIAASLGAGAGELQWILDGYALALAALLLGAGSLADRYGRRRAYGIGLLIFGVSSLICALAPDAATLIGARIVQGIGGAAMYATTAALLNVTYQGRDRGVAFGVWGAVNGAAAAAGPIAGGLLTEHLGWHWIFLVNLPICAAAAWFTYRGVVESRAPRAGRFDVPGTVAFTVGAGALTYGLISASVSGWSAGVTIGSITAGLIGFIVFMVVERRSDHPMLDLGLFRRPAFASLIAAAFLTQAAAFAVMPYTTVWLQRILGHGPVDAGLLGALPMSLASLVVGVFAGRALQGRPARWTVGVGLLLVAAGDLLQTRVDSSSGGGVLIPGLVLVGLGVGMVLPTMSSAILDEVPKERSGMAGGAMNAFRQLGFAFGVAVLGTVFGSAYGSGSFVDGLDTALLIAAGLALVGAVVVLVFARHKEQAAAVAGVAG